MDNRDFIYKIFTSENVAESIIKNLDKLLVIIPEIKPMIGFEHNHPDHHLNVWEHTLEVIRNLNSRDLELNLAGLLHDIGKPFSYQDEEVRHFRGHPEVSAKMSRTILSRIGYDEEFIDRVVYLVNYHDTVIDPDNLDNSIGMVKKRLRLQYADAKAHKPDKVPKRLAVLDDIRNRLDALKTFER